MTDTATDNTGKKYKLVDHHQHQYIIPVEWRIATEHNKDELGRTFKSKKVTKLRCSCGSEIDR